MRKESDLKRACFDYLRVMENLGRIRWHDRLNSGEIFVHGRKIQLCREGTADGWFLTNNWNFIFFETKVLDRKMSEAQTLFKLRVSGTLVFYWEIRSIDQFINECRNIKIK